MRLLTSLETRIIRLSPDELTGDIEALQYLSDTSNHTFLMEYEATWRDAIAPLRKAQRSAA